MGLGKRFKKLFRKAKKIAGHAFDPFGVLTGDKDAPGAQAYRGARRGFTGAHEQEKLARSLAASAQEGQSEQDRLEVELREKEREEREMAANLASALIFSFRRRKRPSSAYDTILSQSFSDPRTILGA